MPEKRAFRQTLDFDTLLTDGDSSKRTRSTNIEISSYVHYPDYTENPLQPRNSSCGLAEPNANDQDDQHNIDLESSPTYANSNSSQSNSNLSQSNSNLSQSNSNLSQSNPNMTNRSHLACPFYKREPERYRFNERTGKSRLCSRGGFPNVHRVKEHIYRCHMAPIQCPKCFTQFGSEDQCKSHLRTSQTCTNLDPKLRAPGISLQQKALLQTKSRKTKTASSEAEKWKAMYEILFPEENVPSAHFEFQTTNQVNQGSQNLDHLAHFESYFQNTLSSHVMAMMRQKIGDGMALYAPDVLAFMPEVLDVCISNVRDDYHNQFSQDSPKDSPNGSDDIEVQAGLDFPVAYPSQTTYTINQVPQKSEMSYPLPLSYDQRLNTTPAPSNLDATPRWITSMPEYNFSYYFTEPVPPLPFHHRATSTPSSIESFSSSPVFGETEFPESFVTANNFTSL